MKLHSITIGQGSQPVVFLHGLFGQGRNFMSVARSLGDVATSHLLDLPNHGQSQWTPEFDLAGQSTHVIDWLRELPEPVTLVGHSLGGKIAMRIALTSPELLSRLVVVDISPVRTDAVSGFASMVSAMRNLDLDSLERRSDADALLAEHIPEPLIRSFLLQNLRRRGGSWFWQANLDLLGDSLSEIGGWPRIEATYSGEVLWIAGGRSEYVRSEHAEPMRALFPNYRRLVIKQASHFVHADEPEIFVEALRQFLS